MFQDRFGARLSRRTALRGAGAIGLAATLTARSEVFALAQEATPTELDYPEVVITATEYAFDISSTIESGFTQLTLDNQGQMDHHAIFLRANEGSTLEDVRAALEQPEFGAVFAVAASVGGPIVGPGQRASVVLDLEPGQYLVVCVIPDENGVPHFAMGMLAEVEVTEGTSTAVAPAADVTVDMVDFAFHNLPTDTSAGTHVLEITNTGPQLHELGVVRLQPGVTFDQIESMLSAPPAATPTDDPAASPMAMEAPFVVIGGIAPMSADHTNWAILDLEAGDYFAICFVPDPVSGAPHFALGMIMPFTVSA